MMNLANPDPVVESRDNSNPESLCDPVSYWERQAYRIHWERFPQEILNSDNVPEARWFGGGRTNLCYNAVDRHAEQRPGSKALIYVSAETGEERVYSFAQLRTEVTAVARMFRRLGVKAGDRVVIYMPMIPVAVFAMLACARLGAVHVVVFGGFASDSLAKRIDDAQPALIVCADAGLRGGKAVPYKPLLDGALDQVTTSGVPVLIYDRGLFSFDRKARDLDWAEEITGSGIEDIPCVWLDAAAPSYVLHTSGTTGKPKGVQRDVGGYAVALATSMEAIFRTGPGEVFFSTSDIGWVVGHSYIVYGPLLVGAATVLFEGTPVYPDAGVLWRIAQDYRVNTMFSAPTAIRVLKKHDPALLSKYDLRALRALFLAGEPLDEATAMWVRDGLGKPVLDNYWQTETGWPILSARWDDRRIGATKAGSCGKPVEGYSVIITDAETGEELPPGNKGLLVVKGPLPPGCLTTLWNARDRYLSTYWTHGKYGACYSTFDWAICDSDGDYFILGRSDDVINVAGHRLGTREIEEVLNSHPAVAESAVVGVEDAIKGQVAWAFVVRLTTDAGDCSDAELMRALLHAVDSRLGAVARPACLFAVAALPKTRSGKVVRRALQALCEGRAPGDLTTLDDANVLEDIRSTVELKQ